MKTLILAALAFCVSSENSFANGNAPFPEPPQNDFYVKLQYVQTKQKMVNACIDKVYAEFKTNRGYEIVGMCSTPAYNPNRPRTAPICVNVKQVMNIQSIDRKIAECAGYKEIRPVPMYGQSAGSN